MAANLVAAGLLGVSLLGALPASAQMAGPVEGASEQPAPAQPSPPLVLLLDGLGVYVESNRIGVSALARPLQQQGFRTRTDSHLMTRSQDIVPDIIIGHSMGGDMALRYGRKLVAAGKPAPLIITIDAAPAPPSCPVPRCTNIHGPGFADVRGAVNIDAWSSGARFVNHAQLPTAPAVQQIILNQTQAFLSARRAARATTRLAPPAGPETSGQGSPAEGPSEATATTGAGARIWTVPGWTLPTPTP